MWFIFLYDLLLVEYDLRDQSTLKERLEWAASLQNLKLYIHNKF